MREDREHSVICESIEPNPSNIFKGEKTPNEKKKQRQGVFLRLTEKGCDQERKIDLLADIFNGTFPLYCYYTDSREYVHKGFVTLNDPMISEMKCILGDDNVVIRK